MLFSKFDNMEITGFFTKTFSSVCINIFIANVCEEKMCITESNNSNISFIYNIYYFYKYYCMGGK